MNPALPFFPLGALAAALHFSAGGRAVAMLRLLAGVRLIRGIA